MPPPAPPLRFTICEGRVRNDFYRSGVVAAHLLTTSGRAVRILVGLPAGNSGAALWFEPTAEPVAIELASDLGEADPDGEMRGISAEVVIRGARELVVQQAVLGSVRLLREHQRTGQLSGSLEPALSVAGEARFSRRSADGAHHYELCVRPAERILLERSADGRLALRGPEPELRFTLVVRTDEPPLTPLALEDLLRESATEDPVARNALAFLSYEEKLLAGSWRFLTYFGRDTLLAVHLLMPVLAPRAIEAALAAVIERLSEDGEVAHEEDIGEHPALRGDRAPVYDCKMVDDDFLLAPVVAHYLLDHPEGRERAERFLARTTSAGRPFADALRRNLDFARSRARPYAAAPAAERLIALRPGIAVGQWRDSEMGLAGGRVPFDVNVALVPAALAAAARLFRHSSLGDETAAKEADRLAAAWGETGRHFRVEIPRAEAQARLMAYAAEIGVPAGEVLEAPAGAAVEFAALALDADGTPLPILHSDGGLLLLFRDPPAREVRAIAEQVERGFPGGLMTPVGLVVANPAYDPSPARRALFGREHYHGAVVWSWQQALLAEGLARQLRRRDLDGETRAALARAEGALWDAIDRTADLKNAELWSWDCDPTGRFEVAPFGQGSNHHDESNAAQLWSTVYLAVKRPA